MLLGRKPSESFEAEEIEKGLHNKRGVKALFPILKKKVP